MYRWVVSPPPLPITGWWQLPPGVSLVESHRSGLVTFGPYPARLHVTTTLWSAPHQLRAG
jgi:hypothetical protein